MSTMMKYTVSLATLLAASAVADAHFIWVIPDNANNLVRVVFSETPAPDDPKLLDKITHSTVQMRDATGKISDITVKKIDDALQGNWNGDGPGSVSAVCRYGVMQRGQSEPFLLMYYASAHGGTAKQPSKADSLRQPWDTLPLQFVKAGDEPGVFQVLWQGKPLVNADFVVSPPGDSEAIDKKTDADGKARIDFKAAGVYGLRVRHIERKSGEYEGKKFQEVRHYATMTIVSESR